MDRFIHRIQVKEEKSSSENPACNYSLDEAIE
jgi:hypothetical protein